MHRQDVTIVVMILALGFALGCGFWELVQVDEPGRDEGLWVRYPPRVIETVYAPGRVYLRGHDFRCLQVGPSNGDVVWRLASGDTLEVLAMGTNDSVTVKVW